MAEPWTPEGLIELGFIGDGASHPLSSVDPGKTLAQWQAQFPPNPTTGSSGANSLNDQIDGLALQRAIDLQVSSGRVAISLPPCRALLSRALVSNGPAAVSIIGRGLAVSRLYFESATGSALLFGQSVPAGTLRIERVTLSSSSTAPALLVTSGAVPSIEMIDNFVRGFSGGGLRGHNITASTFRRNIFSTLGGPSARTADCFVLTESQGCFQNFWEDNQILGFSYAFNWSITSNPSYEGQYLIRNQINEAVGAFRNANTSSYQPPDWKFIQNEMECEGVASDLYKLSNVIFTDQFMLSLGGNSPETLFRFRDIVSLNIVRNDASVFNLTRTFYRISNCVGTRVRDNTFVYLGPSTPTGILLDGPNTDFSETGSSFPAWPVSGSPKIAGQTIGHQCEIIAVLAGADVSRLGAYTLVRSLAGTTNSDGVLTLTFPSKPDGSSLFSEPPVLVCSTGDTQAGGGDIVAPLVVSASSATVRFITGYNSLPAGNQPRRVNYTAVGR